MYHNRRSYNVWFLKYKVRQTEISVILGHFLCFQLPDNPESQNFKTEKNTWRYYHFKYLHHKWQSYDVWFSEIWSATEIIFCHSGLFVALLPPYGPRKSKFWGNEKNIWRYYHFANVYYKWESYNVWFLRHGMQQTKIFFI